MSIEIANSFNDIHMPKEKLESWKELWHTVGFIFLDDLLKMSKGDEMDWENFHSCRGANPWHRVLSSLLSLSIIPNCM